MKTLFHILTLFFLCTIQTVFAGTEVANKIKSFSDKEFVSYSLFQPSSTDFPEIKREVSNYKLFNTDYSVVKQIIKTNPNFIRLTIGDTKLILYRVSIHADGFSVTTSENESYTGIPIVHYRGIIENNYNSLASISVSEKEVCGFYSDATSNKVIGKLLTKDVHIVYDDRYLTSLPQFHCTTIPNPTIKTKTGTIGLAATKCVRFYLEVDNDIYVARGSDLANVTTFIEGAFAQVATLYANDGMTIKISQLYIWTTTDPFVGPGMGDYLYYFASYRSTFNGDLSHLIGYDGGGGIAFLNGLCSTVDNKAGYSVVNTNYSIIPTFSWTVEVLAHEMGHQVASPHTHDCVWNGNNTAIDGCGPYRGYTGSGTCPQAALPTTGGTIMSYCHLISTIGINFNNGFGPQPAALMNNTIAARTCLTTCDTTTPPPPPPPPGCTVAPATPGVISGPTRICKFAQNVQYSIQPVATATSYKWTVPAGCAIVINGTVYGTTVQTTNTTIGVNFGNKKGKIQVRAINNCGTSAARSLSFSFNCREGVNIPTNQLTVFPNPASSHLSISFDNDTEDNYLVSIVDNTGKVVYETNQRYNEGLNSNTIDISHLTNGIYTIKISNSEQYHVKKFLILK